MTKKAANMGGGQMTRQHTERTSKSELIESELKQRRNAKAKRRAARKAVNKSRRRNR
jgi:hypothetical protein